MKWNEKKKKIELQLKLKRSDEQSGEMQTAKATATTKSLKYENQSN